MLFSKHLSNDGTLFQLDIMLTHHELAKLQRFAESVADADNIGLIQDITDSLKSMIKDVKKIK